MFRNIPLSIRMVFFFLIAGLVPFIVIGSMSFATSSRALEEAAFNQLHSIREIQKERVKGLFDDSIGEVKVLSKSADVKESLVGFTEAFEADGNQVAGSDWTALESERGAYFSEFMNTNGYYDIFLVSQAGDVVFTVAKEADLGENMINGKYASSGLGECIQKAFKGEAVVDFRPYAPSNDDPASFIGFPVRQGNETIGVLAVQVSIARINEIMSERAGLGESGESYLVGTDFRMRSDSRLDPEHRTVLASFRGSVETNGVDTEASRDAIAGNEGEKIITDYMGSQVLSSYTPVKIGDMHWALIVEIDKAEAFAAVTELFDQGLFVGVIVLLGVLGMAIFVARNVNSTIINPVKEVITRMSQGATQVESASSQVAQSSQQLASSASEQASSLEEVSSSIVEFASVVKRNADSSQEARNLSSDAANTAEKGNLLMASMNDAINKIELSSNEIVKVMKTIDEIAFQTNLLALNAAVEAARAGEAGKGFAVVAEEVRNLAQRSANASQSTAQMIEESQANAKNGVDVSRDVTQMLEDILGKVKNASDLSQEIATASENQTMSIDQLKSAIGEMDGASQSNAAISEQSASSSEELLAQSKELMEMINVLGGIIGTRNDDARHHQAGGYKGNEYSGLLQS